MPHFSMHGILDNRFGGVSFHNLYTFVLSKVTAVHALADAT